jgi:hypothetical protein
LSPLAVLLPTAEATKFTRSHPLAILLSFLGLALLNTSLLAGAVAAARKLVAVLAVAATLPGHLWCPRKPIQSL